MTTPMNPYYLAAFIAFILVALVVDLSLLKKSDGEVSIKSALRWSFFWISLAIAFGIWIYFQMGATPAVTYFTGYIVELSLSVDNLFVFILIFGSMKIKPQYQHRVLFWGILGALVMRGICIGIGVAALQRFSFLEFIFAGILIFAGIKTLMEDGDGEPEDPSQGRIARIVKRFLPIDHSYEGEKFFIRKEVQGTSKLVATPLFLTLILVEASDVIFAVDSIPAVLAVTKDPFLVYTSNIFAILGLRSLYFILANLVQKFRYLGTGVGLILVFIGIKMVAGHWYEIPVHYALIVIVATISLSILASAVLKESDAK